MPFIEAPTSFYLGRRYDPAANQVTNEVVYYDARDLTTHAVVVGMTGSGKTGLCITLLEEAILDNIPAIIIDPKGDITNLLLTFPDMRPEDFIPWVNVDDARRAGLDIPAYAADVAQRWRDGLSNWGIVPDRLRWLKGIAKYSIYTPGSDAGLPVSILASLAAPREGWNGNEEFLREKIKGIVTALLALVGMSADPVKSKEHVLISNIFEYAWQRGISPTLEDIILQVQKPPFDKLGVFPVDEYLSERARMKLAMDLNNIVAAPSFQSWIRGEPLNIHALLHEGNGRAHVSVFYIAHLSEPERQFIITLLLENILSWMRMQSGTPSLRALLYIDEMFGYFPPYPLNPPTKDPLMRLIKQARSFGLGLILATQNPGDLDYKGLTNAGTWFIGRLQSENDKAKVMSGLESLASAEAQMNLRDVERLVADIQPRVFIMNNIHDPGGPVLVHTRWAMNYLRGPLTRQQIGLLMADQKAELAARLGMAAPAPGQTQPLATSAYGLPLPPAPPGFGGGGTQNLPLPPLPPEFGAQAAPAQPPLNPAGFSQQVTVPPGQAGFSQIITQGTQATVRGPAAPPGFTSNPPPVSSSVMQYFLPASLTHDQALRQWEQQTRIAIASIGASAVAYSPVLLAQAVVRYQDRKASVFTARTFAYAVPNVQKVGLIHWEEYAIQPVDSRRITHSPQTAAIYGDLPTGLSDTKRLTALRAELTDVIYNTGALRIPFNPTLNFYGSPDADISEYWAQAQQLARERRDAESDELAARYEKILDRLDEQYRRKTRELSAEKKELADRKREELFTKGEAVLSLLKGRTTYTLSRTSRAARQRRQTKEDLRESQEVISELEQQIEEMERRFEAEIKAVNDKWARVATEAQEYRITPFKKDIQMELFGIGWLPYYYIEVNGQPLLLPGL